MNPVKTDLLGLGTVGGGILRILQRNQEEIRRRTGYGIEVAMIAMRNLDKAHATIQEAGATVPVMNDPFATVDSPEIDIVVELTSSYDLACELVLRVIINGKHVVTANRALLTMHGNGIFKIAQDRGVMVALEAVVAGGTPIIKVLRGGLTASRIEWITDTINGTTNFILSEMHDKGLGFDTVLKGAQRLDYTEASPTFDIEDFSAAHKLALMNAIAFSVPMQFERTYVEGITKLEAVDIRYAEELDYRIELPGITHRVETGIELRVHLTLVLAKRLVANVENAMNAMVINGSAVGPTLYYGKGVGAEPTASAIVVDLVGVTCLYTADLEYHVSHPTFRPDALSDMPVLPIDKVCSSHHLRVRVADEIGVLADITHILAEGSISIDAMLQKEPREGKPQTDIIVLSHVTVEKHVNAAIAATEALSAVLSKVARIRMEELS